MRLLALLSLLATVQREARAQQALCTGPVPAGDTVRFTGVAGRERAVSSLGFWSASAVQLSYLERWRSDTVTRQLKGDIPLDSSGRVRADAVPVGQLQRAPVLAVLAECAHAAGDSITTRAGMMRLRASESVNIRIGGALARVTLFIVAIDGHGEVTRLWLDASGHFFGTSQAEGSADFLLPASRPALATSFLVAEAHAAEARMRVTSNELITLTPRGTAFVHARVVDVSRGTTLDSMTVVVIGNSIVDVSRDGVHPIPPGAHVVDATGKSLLPGLWDLGQNVGHGADAASDDERGRMLLAQGITSVLDLNGDTLFTPLIAGRIAAGAQLGPSLHGACFMDGWYPDGVSGAVPRRIGEEGQVKDATEVATRIEACARAGARVVTLYPVLDSALAASAIADAHRRGMQVTGDALAGMSTAELLSLGYDQFGHLGQVLMPFVQADDHDRSAWLLQRVGGGITYLARGREIALLNLSSTPIRELVLELSRRRITVQSSFCVYEVIGKRGDAATSAAAFLKFRDFGRMLHEARVPVVVGTDGACTLVHELQILRDVGFSNAELLRMVTLDAARFMGRDRVVGSVARGMGADLVLVDGNPLEDIGALSKPVLVLAGGRLLSDLQGLAKALPFLTSAR